jgi:hypothetical protein
MTEFLRLVCFGEPTSISPIAARNAVAAGALATESLRNGSVPLDVPPVSEHIVSYFSHRTISSPSATTAS